jgi:HD-GYP domain-containing protein (c-di-GMP phosphodiesterase class II)
VGRICAVCDVFDALLSDRPYKEPWPVPEALDQLRSERGKHFDPTVVDAFLAIVGDLDPALMGPSARPAPAPADTPGPPAAAPRLG